MTKRTAEPNPSLKSFEDALQNLDQLVRRLEAGELSLEQSLASFEEGIALVRLLNERLAEAEQRVDILTKNANGELEVVPAEGSLGKRS